MNWRVSDEGGPSIPLNTFTQAIDAFRTAMSFQFID